MSVNAIPNMTVKSYELTRRTRERKEVAQQREGQQQRVAIELATATDGHEWRYAKQDAYWAKRIGAELVSKYPGHGWEVLVDIRNGVAKIYNLYISGHYGYLLHLKDIREATFSRDMMRVGGELLRRSGIKHDRMCPEEIAQLQHASNHRIKVDLS